MRIIHRRVKLARLGAVLVSAAAVAGIIWPDRAQYLAQLAAAIAALLGAVAALLTVDKVAAIKAGTAMSNRGQGEDAQRSDGDGA